jgi:chromosome segregation ATPase
MTDLEKEYADAKRKFESLERRLTSVERRLDNQHDATEQVIRRLSRLERALFARK